jgi:predicted XRE-type DNA-binding protein
MSVSRRERVAVAGWREGSVAELLGLSREEAMFVEVKLALARFLREVREARGLSQREAARVLGSSQSRVAKMEAADATVTLDLLVKSLFGLGASPKQVGRVLATAA